ncbi:MAG TPA: ABC transporter permease [Usitatibacter sp.]|nr:ABC transporter permease [Usitatibacter sp.]
MAVSTLAGRIRGAAWLGWQIESNWADTLTFVTYALLRPLGTALILTGMYWAVAGQASRRDAFAAFYVANAFHEYVVRLLIGMGWVIVEEREEYETLKYVFVSPVGMRTYLAGRSVTKFALATVSATLLLVVGWFVLGVRWDWGAVRVAPLLLSAGLALTATVFLGFLVAGWALLLPRVAMTLNEGLGIALYLLCGVVFPIDLLPRGLQELSLLLPFTYGYECVRRFLLGAGVSHRLAAWSDTRILVTLAVSTVVFALVSSWGYGALERKARRAGKIDQTTLF